MAGRRIPHADGRHVAMPLGGIGTGTVAVGADGGLRQWQFHHIGNHHGDLPGSFFAVRATQWEPAVDELRVLQARPVDGPPTPMVDDDAVPDWQRRLAGRYGVDGATFSAVYPRASVELHDTTLPVRVTMDLQNPLVPLDTDASSLPVVMATFTLHNPTAVPVHGLLGGALQNAVGYDGVTPVDGVRASCYGGNTNRVLRSGGWTHVLLENHTLPAEHPGAGQMVLAADDPNATVHLQWRDPEEFFAFLRGRAMGADVERLTMTPTVADHQVGGPTSLHRPSAPGETWNAGVAVPFFLEPGATTTVRLLLTWHFANRYVDFPQFGPGHPQWGPTRFWLGNHYALAHEDALAVARDVEARWTGLTGATKAWTELLADGALDATAVEHLAAQAAIIRSPTCFRTADGAFFGFEGVNGASTRGHAGDVGGSCPLNCTHVWNYAQGVARLFPELERSMRTTELGIMQAPSGTLPHRVVVPTYLPQLWDVPIGGPDAPALDGMLGTVLKTYREVRNGAGLDWLRRCWPGVRRLLSHVRSTWDPAATGVLRGVQPSTHDIDLRGVNSFMGSLWLAALRAAQEMALLVDGSGDAELAAELSALFERGSDAYDTLLFSGEYYVQVLDPGEVREFQWEQGCLADQLIGQWWAHQLGLGYVLPREHVVSALRAVVRHNLRTGFDDLVHPFRVFADGDDTGLLMCTWPTGGRPEVPTRYCDEVWTGSEYQVAAHCLHEGLIDEATAILDGVWARYDGRRRNPYNEIECGDHYVRALAGWSVVDAMTGQQWDAVRRDLTVKLPDDDTWLPVVLDTGWGRVGRRGGEIVVECLHGSMAIEGLTVTLEAAGGASTESRRRLDVGDGIVVTPGAPATTDLDR
ncbi:GH116 family glycosyl-hydrolase [Cellulomonas sp. KRMCY2]|uniref:GH116 family glycosyl-hydrolase n=1 Tax=Cellulomonas sp. KRMCY2 TaxID=1304865 RepID=UPI00045E8263|nr:GH116 family glycosyl-hydrolase [Cellulomonas sp. KRMCY2]